MDERAVRAALTAASSVWVRIPPGVQGDPNTIDVFSLAIGLEDNIASTPTAAAFPKTATGIAMVEAVEAFLGGQLVRHTPQPTLVARGVALARELVPVLEAHEPIAALFAAFCTWHGCIGMAKSLRVETSAHEQYTLETRTRGYADLQRSWEDEEKRGNGWIRYGVTLAKPLELKRGNRMIDEWVPRGSPYWEREK